MDGYMDGWMDIFLQFIPDTLPLSTEMYKDTFIWQVFICKGSTFPIMV